MTNRSHKRKRKVVLNSGKTIGNKKKKQKTRSSKRIYCMDDEAWETETVKRIQ